MIGRTATGVVAALALSAGAAPSLAATPDPTAAHVIALGATTGYVLGTSQTFGTVNGSGTVPTAAIRQGQALQLTTLDVNPHTVTSDDVVPDPTPTDPNHTKPLFESGPAGLGATVDVSGVTTLPAGSYAFHCQVHSQMTGVLVVLPA